MEIRTTAALPLNTKQPATVAKEDPALKKACSDFESLLVSQMLKKMRDTLPKTDLFGSKDKEEIFQSMLDDETAKHLSENGSLGLADLLYSQLSTDKTAKAQQKAVDK
jgi:peptidoglycan hydrolase FlgJ